MSNPIELQEAKIKIIKTFIEVFKCKPSNIEIEQEAKDWLILLIAIPECIRLKFHIDKICVLNGGLSGTIRIDSFSNETKFIDNGNFFTSLDTQIIGHVRNYFNNSRHQYNLLSYLANSVITH